jgi:hypothetical protein
MKLTRKEVIEQMCEIRGLVYHSIGNYADACDCLCDFTSDFRSTDFEINYIKQAVIEKLKRDGYRISEFYDPESGKMITL